jgi:tetratricopeptide (TPR) repeat protein
MCARASTEQELMEKGKAALDSGNFEQAGHMFAKAAESAAIAGGKSLKFSSSRKEFAKAAKASKLAADAFKSLGTNLGDALNKKWTGKNHFFTSEKIRELGRRRTLLEKSEQNWKEAIHLFPSSEDSITEKLESLCDWGMAALNHFRIVENQQEDLHILEDWWTEVEPLINDTPKAPNLLQKIQLLVIAAEYVVARCRLLEERDEILSLLRTGQNYLADAAFGIEKFEKSNPNLVGDYHSALAINYLILSSHESDQEQRIRLIHDVIESIQNAIEYHKKMGFTKLLANDYLRQCVGISLLIEFTSDINEKERLISESLEAANQSVKLWQETNEYFVNAPTVYNNLASIYAEKEYLIPEDDAEAREKVLLKCAEYLKKGLESALTPKYGRTGQTVMVIYGNLAATLCDLMEVAERLGDKNRTMKYIREGLEVCDQAEKISIPGIYNPYVTGQVNSLRCEFTRGLAKVSTEGKRKELLTEAIGCGEKASRMLAEVGEVLFLTEALLCLGESQMDLASITQDVETKRNFLNDSISNLQKAVKRAEHITTHKDLGLAHLRLASALETLASLDPKPDLLRQAEQHYIAAYHQYRLLNWPHSLARVLADVTKMKIETGGIQMTGPIVQEMLERPDFSLDKPCKFYKMPSTPEDSPICTLDNSIPICRGIWYTFLESLLVLGCDKLSDLAQSNKRK